MRKLVGAIVIAFAVGSGAYSIWYGLAPESNALLAAAVLVGSVGCIFGALTLWLGDRK